MSGASPAVKRSCRNSNTVPTGQLTGSRWWSLHHEVKTLYFKAYIFPVEGALECRRVSTTSVERPESISRAPSEAKSTVSTVLDGGEISSPLLGTEGPSWWGAPEEARRGGTLYLGTILCPATYEGGCLLLHGRNPPLVIYVGDHQCVVWVDEHMVAPEIC